MNLTYLFCLTLLSWFSWFIPKRNAYPSAPGSRNWGGVNSYFLHAFHRPNGTEVLDAIAAAHLRTLRVFISYTPANNKETGSVYMPDIEPDKVGVYDDTQLVAIDQLMVEAQPRGIKLIITLHDRYELGCWGNDSYASKFDFFRLSIATMSRPVPITRPRGTSIRLRGTSIRLRSKTLTSASSTFLSIGTRSYPATYNGRTFRTSLPLTSEISKPGFGPSYYEF